MSKETFAIINDQDQVVNHIIADKDAPDFSEIMASQLAHWNCVRYVETTETKPMIILSEDKDIWTTHTDSTGFVLPEGYSNTIEIDLASALSAQPQSLDPNDYDHEIVIIKGRVYPADSLLIKENASRRPEGYVVPEGAEVSLADAE